MKGGKTLAEERIGKISKRKDTNNHQEEIEMNIGIIEGKIEIPRCTGEEVVPKGKEILQVNGEGSTGMENHGHVTREDLFDEEENISKGVNRDEMLIRMPVSIGLEEDVDVVIDTGATHSCISHQCYIKLREGNLIQGELPVTKVTLIIAVGKKVIDVKTQVVLYMKWNGNWYTIHALVVPGLFTSVVIGLNWLRKYNISINCRLNKLIQGRMDQEEVQEGVPALIQSEENQVEKVMKMGVQQGYQASCILRLLKKHQRSDEKWSKIILTLEDNQSNKGRSTRAYCIYQGI